MEKLGNVLIQVMQDLSRISTNGRARIRVNSTLADPEQFEALFDYFSKGTIIEHVDLDVDPMETKMRCSCGAEKTVEGDHPGYQKCPSCGRFAEIEDSGYELVEPDPEQVGMRTSIRF